MYPEMHLHNWNNVSTAQYPEFRPCVTQEDEELRKALIALLTFVPQPQEPTDDDIRPLPDLW